MSCRSGRLWFSLQDSAADSLGRPGAMQESPVDTKLKGLKHEKCRDHFANVAESTVVFAQTKDDKPCRGWQS